MSQKLKWILFAGAVAAGLIIGFRSLVRYFELQHWLLESHAPREAYFMLRHALRIGMGAAAGGAGVLGAAYILWRLFHYGRIKAKDPRIAAGEHALLVLQGLLRKQQELEQPGPKRRNKPTVRTAEDAAAAGELLAGRLGQLAQAQQTASRAEQTLRLLAHDAVERSVFAVTELGYADSREAELRVELCRETSRADAAEAREAELLKQAELLEELRLRLIIAVHDLHARIAQAHPNAELPVVLDSATLEDAIALVEDAAGRIELLVLHLNEEHRAEAQELASLADDMTRSEAVDMHQRLERARREAEQAAERHWQKTVADLREALSKLEGQIAGLKKENSILTKREREAQDASRRDAALLRSTQERLQQAETALATLREQAAKHVDIDAFLALEASERKTRYAGFRPSVWFDLMLWVEAQLAADIDLAQIAAALVEFSGELPRQPQFVPAAWALLFMERPAGSSFSAGKPFGAVLLAEAADLCSAAEGTRALTGVLRRLAVQATAINPDFYFGIPLDSRPEIAELLDRNAKCAIAGQAMTLRGEYLARMQKDSFLLCLTAGELSDEARAYLALLLKDDPVAACIALFMNRDDASARACLMLPPWVFYALLTAALQADFDETLLDGDFAGLLAQITVDQAALVEDPLQLIGYWPILQLARELKKGGRSCASSKQATASALAALQLKLFQTAGQTAARTQFTAAAQKVDDALADRD